MLFNKGDLAALGLFSLVYISWGLTDSIQAPFYPIKADELGATPAQYGFVFGIIHLAIFISGPIFGIYMHKLGVRKVYFFGIIVTALCALAFGCLDFVQDKTTFLVLSYMLRVFEGIAEAASWSAVFSMLLRMFPSNVATVYSITEASFSFAEMIGPTFGAFLYNAGGFILPFEICGGLCLITGLFTIFVLPKRKNDGKELANNNSTNNQIALEEQEMSQLESKPLLETLTENFEMSSASESNSSYDMKNQITVIKRSDIFNNANNDNGKKLISKINSNSTLTTTTKKSNHAPSVKTEISRAISYRSHRAIVKKAVSQDDYDQPNIQLLPVLKNPKVLIALSGTVFGASVQGLLEANLEQFLEGFNLNISQIGYSFLGLSVPYFIVSPAWGYICDNLVNPKIIQPIGHGITAIGLLIIGPVSYIPPNIIPPSYGLTIGGLVLLGLGTAALLVASFSGAQKAAMEANKLSEDDIHAAISGIWTSAFALGNFIGPTFGGLLVDGYNFETTTTVFQVTGILLLLMEILNLICFSPELTRSKSDSYENLP